MRQHPLRRLGETRMLQVHVPETVWRFKSSRPHQYTNTLRSTAKLAQKGGCAHS